MQLPSILREAIEQEAHGFALSALSESSAQLSKSYRRYRPTNVAQDADAIAYLTSRMPATYAAAKAILIDMRDRSNNLQVKSILDIGAGPGAAAWASVEVFPGAKQVTLVDKDQRLIKFGKSLAEKSGVQAMADATWSVADLRHTVSFKTHDLVLLSYVVGELAQAQFLDLVKMAWDATRNVLAVIEPGTTRGFAHIRLVRDMLIRCGAHVVSPCPHGAACPMQPPDWCHFAQRVERSSLHRRSKGGTLGFEDEKYSYVAVSKTPATTAPARIVSRPVRTSGSIEFTVCAREGLQESVVTRKNRAAFRAAQKAKWGSAWDPQGGPIGDSSAKIETVEE